MEALTRPFLDTLTGRILAVSFLPTAGGACYLLALVLAGTPRHSLSAARLWRNASSLSLTEVAILLVATLAVGIVFGSVQLLVVRGLSGDLPPPLSTVGRRYQRWRRRRLASKIMLSRESLIGEEAVRDAGLAAARLQSRFPGSDHVVRATALGNVLAAIHDHAGRVYGYDPVVAWPHLYPVLSTQVKTLVDDRRDLLDAASRTCATWLVVGFAAAFLVPFGGDWFLSVGIAAGVATMSYYTAVAAAVAYGESVTVAFAVHRFDLLNALHLPLPADEDSERMANEALSRHWRQGTPVRVPYTHESLVSVSVAGLGPPGTTGGGPFARA